LVACHSAGREKYLSNVSYTWHSWQKDFAQIEIHAKYRVKGIGFRLPITH